MLVGLALVVVGHAVVPVVRDQGRSYTHEPSPGY